MIITDRQQKIIQLLEKNDLTSEKIAEYLDVSTRTIMRDIAELNDSFQANHLAEIEANYQGQGYHLTIYDSQQFSHHINLKPNVPLNILLTLTAQPDVLLIDLQEKFYLSKSAVSKILMQLKDQYSAYIDINAKPSKGYQLTSNYSTRLFLAANILLEDKATLYSLFALNPRRYQQLLELVDRQWLTSEFNFLSPTQFLLLALAASLVFPNSTAENESHLEYLSANLINDEPSITAFLTDFYAQVVSVFNIKIDSKRLTAFAYHLHTVKFQLQSLSIENINSALNQTSLLFHMQFKSPSSLVMKIFTHLERCVAFPRLINNFDDIDQLILVNPMIYNFSHYFLSALNKIQQFVILDDSYTFLYFLCAHSAYQTEYKIGLISSRWSIANINKKLIEDKIPNANVVCYVGEHYLDNHHTQQYVIWNQDDRAPSSLPIDMEIKGILEPSALTLLKSNLDELTVKLGIEQRFKQPEIIKLNTPGNPNNSWLETMQQCCQILQEHHWIEEQDARQIILRESQGHSLIINDIAIPHASSVYVEQFALFYFQLDKPQLLEGHLITQILLVLVNPDHKENSNIFSYLYKVLNQQSKEQLTKIMSLPQLQNILLNNSKRDDR